MRFVYGEMLSSTMFPVRLISLSKSNIRGVVIPIHQVRTVQLLRLSHIHHNHGNGDQSFSYRILALTAQSHLYWDI